MTNLLMMKTVTEGKQRIYTVFVTYEDCLYNNAN